MLQRAFQNLAALETNLDETNFVAVKLRKKKKKEKSAIERPGNFPRTRIRSVYPIT